MSLLSAFWTRVPALVTAALSLTASIEPGPPPRASQAVLRLHHLHFTVGNPAAAIKTYAATLAGVRTVVPGFGVGVRVGDQYLVFDRGDESSNGLPVAPAVVYREAVAWLRAHGAVVQPGDFSDTRLSSLGAAPRIDHVAFAAADLPAAIAALRERGAEPLRTTGDSALFRATGGLDVEIVRDTTAPDVYWCPMHPDVRSAAPGVCPICAMDFVAIPPPRLGEYRMDVTAVPNARGGVSKLRLVIRDPESGSRVPAFATVHERLLHFFVVGRDLEYFEHLHPEPAGEGTFELTHDIPAGEYMLVADFLPQAGSAQMLQRTLVTAGYAGALFQPASLEPDTGIDKVVDGVRIHLDATNVRAGRDAVLRFTLSDAVTGAALDDLQPYLGAPGHMLAVSGDLTDAIHSHSEEQKAGPVVTFTPMLPAAGVYKVWAQFQRRGKVLTVAFVMVAQKT